MTTTPDQSNWTDEQKARYALVQEKSKARQAPPKPLSFPRRPK